MLVLRYFEDLPEAEIAALLGCSAGSVKTHAQRGLRTLRELLGGDWPQSRVTRMPAHERGRG